MPQTVTLPGEHSIEFPDGMSPAEMTHAIERDPHLQRLIHPESFRASGEFTDQSSHPVRELVLSYQGTPYRFGGTGCNGMDCSSFSQHILSRLGARDVPRTAEAQFAAGQFVPPDPQSMRPGDAVFFKNTYKPGISHVGIYLGNGQYAHMSSGEGGLAVSSMGGNWYRNHFAGVRRFISSPARPAPQSGTAGANGRRPSQVDPRQTAAKPNLDQLVDAWDRVSAAVEAQYGGEASPPKRPAIPLPAGITQQQFDTWRGQFLKPPHIPYDQMLQLATHPERDWDYLLTHQSIVPNPYGGNPVVIGYRNTNAPGPAMIKYAARVLQAHNGGRPLTVMGPAKSADPSLLDRALAALNPPEAISDPLLRRMSALSRMSPKQVGALVRSSQTVQPPSQPMPFAHEQEWAQQMERERTTRPTPLPLKAQRAQAIMQGDTGGPKSLGEIFTTPFGLGESAAQVMTPRGSDLVSAAVRAGLGFMTPASALMAGGAGEASSLSPLVARLVSAGFSVQQAVQAAEELKQGRTADAVIAGVLSGGAGLYALRGGAPRTPERPVTPEQARQMGEPIQSTRSIFVLRHAKAGDALSIKGQTDTPFSAEGQRQATQEIAPAMASTGVSRIVSGPRSRHIDTARAIAEHPGNPAKRVQPLQELDSWDRPGMVGQKWTDAVKAKVLELVEHPDTTPPGGGETHRQFASRVIPPLLDMMRAQENGAEPAAMVVSNPVLSTYRAWVANGMPADYSVNPQVFIDSLTRPGEIFELRRGENGWEFRPYEPARGSQRPVP